MAIPEYKSNIQLDTQRTVTPASGQRAQAQITNMFAEINNDINLVGQERLKERGVKQGEKYAEEIIATGADLTEFTKGLPTDGTNESAAFEKAAFNTYQIELASQADKRFTELSNEHINDPDGFLRTSNAYLEGVLEKLPEEFRGDVRNTLSPRLNNRYAAVINQSRATQRSEFKNIAVSRLAEISANAALAQRSGDEETYLSYISEGNQVIQGMKEAGFFATEEAYQQSLKDFSQQAEKELYFAQMEIAVDKTAFLEDLISGETVGSFEGEEKRKLVKSLRAYKADLEAIEKDFSSEQQSLHEAERAKRTSDLEIAINRGELKQKDIEESFARGDITAAKRVELTKKMDSIKANAEKKATLQSEVNRAIDGGIPMDITNPSHVEAVDEYYKSQIEPFLEGKEAFEQIEIVSNYIDKVGFTPTEVKRFISTAVNIDDPAYIEKAISFYDIVSIKDHNALARMKPKDTAYLSMLSKMTKAGVEVPQAIERARFETDTNNQAMVTARKQELKEQQRDWFAESYLDRAIEVFDEDVPIDTRSVGPRLAADYQELYERHYIASGDDEYAKEMADTLITRTWGVTEIDGSDRVMKHPPERYYSVRGEVDWVREQMIEDVKAYIPEVEDEDDIYIMSDSGTARTAGSGNPDYLIFVKNVSGELITVSAEDGIPLRWQPDREKYRQQLKKEAQKKRERIKKVNTFFRKMSGGVMDEVLDMEE